MTGGMVLILGLTGRNFAAGMSGGIAYVYDIDGSFRAKTNAESVELLLLNQEKDKKIVKDLLTEFYEHTNSVVAHKLLTTWPVESTKFVKIFPYEYQKALKALEEKQQQAAAEIEEPKTIVTNGIEPSIKDIEDSVDDIEAEEKRLTEILDKTKYENCAKFVGRFCFYLFTFFLFAEDSLSINVNNQFIEMLPNDKKTTMKYTIFRVFVKH